MRAREPEMRSMAAADRRGRWILWLIWLLAGLALLLSLVRGTVVNGRITPIADGATTWCHGGFQMDGVYPETDGTVLPAQLRRMGSWINGDGWRGDAETAWLPLGNRAVTVFVAGYPQHPGCGLWAEFRRSDGSVARVACPLGDPRETWQGWRLRAPSDATALRLVAQDHASDNAGWLAFTEPVITADSFNAAFMAAQVFTTIALTFVLVWGPGLLCLRLNLTMEVRTAILFGAGPFILVLLGLVIWAVGGAIRPHYVAFVAVAGLWGALGIGFWRSPPSLRGEMAIALLVSMLVVIATAAKASYSGGPEGELYGGTISRTLEVGDRSDARISFHVVQTVGRHFAPWNPAAEAYFSPWTFFSRGPLAGLAAAPVSMATSGRPPASMPDQAWTPFDTTGFAAYRIVLMTLASGVVVALFITLKKFVDDRWALLGTGVFALCPFVVHDVMFTWPKWEATVWVLLAFLFADERRGFAAGLTLAIGFLYHPLAGLWAPWLALWAATRPGTRFRSATTNTLWMGAGFCGLAGAWMLAGKFAPHLSSSTDAGQLGFLSYFRLADYVPADWSSWWHTRWMNFSNTFVPFWLITHHADRLGSVYGPVGWITKFSFSWWNTLPLGMGLLLWAMSLFAAARAVMRFAGAVFVLLVGPALLLVAYWGAHPLGLMRECGHPLFVAIVGMVVLVAARNDGWISRLLAHPVFPWLQVPEQLLMLWLSTWSNPRPASPRFAELDWLYAGVSAAALLGVAWLLARARTGMASAAPCAATAAAAAHLKRAMTG
jgi:hypothetical protein